MASKATYTVTGLRAVDLMHPVVRVFTGAPGDASLAAWARQRSTGALDMATRYFPSRKGWLILDMRQAHVRLASKPGGPAYWSGIKRLPRTYPSEDAAVMKMIHMLSLPVQQDLNL